MDRKAVARQTLEILKSGTYTCAGRQVEISKAHQRSVKDSRLFTPIEGEEILRNKAWPEAGGEETRLSCRNMSTVDAVLELVNLGRPSVGVLNFASAKNPGGGFLNGAMAQEESIAASSGLYRTLTVHEEYYRINRACGTMVYTDHAIYSPDVVFFRDGRFELLEQPVTASVLTLPAVNMGQVILKGEDVREAERAMRHRMELALALFAHQGNKNLVLGAYGCGVFRNDPEKIAAWWQELLDGPFAGCFDQILFAVLDRSAKQTCIRAFEKRFG